MLRSSISSKKVLQMLGMSLIKTGNQFSVMSKGRAIYLRFMSHKQIVLPKPNPTPKGSIQEFIDELSQLRKQFGILRGQTHDVILNIAAYFVDHR